jgi:hypothetical protein
VNSILATRIFALLAFGLACGLGNVAAQGLHFGTNIVSPGKVITFNAPLNGRARMETARFRMTVQNVQGALIAPASLTNLTRACPLLIVSVPSGGSAIRWMPTVTNLAMEMGWAVLAADGPKVEVNQDTIEFGWGVLSSVLEQFARTWPPARQWPVVCTGFSGGAKRSAAVGAAMTREGWRVIGVFMGGCNEDRASLGLQMFQPGDRFKQVPFFLSNGASDPIANPEQGAAVVASMRHSGFTTLRLESYEGGHRQNLEHLEMALHWFQQLAAGRTPHK